MIIENVSNIHHNKISSFNNKKVQEATKDIDTGVFGQDVNDETNPLNKLDILSPYYDTNEVIKVFNLRYNEPTIM